MIIGMEARVFKKIIIYSLKAKIFINLLLEPNTKLMKNQFYLPLRNILWDIEENKQ